MGLHSALNGTLFRLISIGLFGFLALDESSGLGDFEEIFTNDSGYRKDLGHWDI